MSCYGFSCRELRENGIHCGFRAKLYKSHVDVIIADPTKVLLRCTSSTNNVHVYSLNPYGFRDIVQQILDSLVKTFQPSLDSVLSYAPPDKQQQWLRKKVERYACVAIHAEWTKLLARMDQNQLAIARALFAANFKKGSQAGVELLICIDRVSKEHRRDIMEFVPAAMLAHHEPSYFAPQPSKISVAYAEALEMDDEAAEWMELQPGQHELTGDEDWRSYYCHDSFSTIPDVLTETLRLVRPGTAVYTVNRLKGVPLERVLSSKAELVLAGESICAGFNNKTSFQVSDKENILTSIKVLNSADTIMGTKLNCRKTDHIILAAHEVDNIHIKDTQTMLKLTERTVEKILSKKVRVKSRKVIFEDMPPTEPDVVTTHKKLAEPKDFWDF